MDNNEKLKPAELEQTETQQGEQMVIDTSIPNTPQEYSSLLHPMELDNAIECLLFCSPTPLPAKQLCHFIGKETTLGEVKQSIQRLKEKYDQPSYGLKLEIFKHGIQFRTKSAYSRFLKNFSKQRPWRISPQAMEVLSIIAYRQPIHRAAIDEIRATDSSHLLYTLIDKGLVHMADKAEDLPGKPMRYGTTSQFLEVFSLSSLEDLPTPKEVEREFEPSAL